MDFKSKIIKERKQGALLGGVLPVLALLIANYILLQNHPITVDEFGLLRVQKSYTSFLIENLTDPGKYLVFFCLSINMLLVLFFTSKKRDALAKGVVIPTVLFAVILVSLRLLL